MALDKFKGHTQNPRPTFRNIQIDICANEPTQSAMSSDYEKIQGTITNKEGNKLERSKRYQTHSQQLTTVITFAKKRDMKSSNWRMKVSSWLYGYSNFSASRTGFFFSHSCSELISEHKTPYFSAMDFHSTYIFICFVAYIISSKNVTIHLRYIHYLLYILT